MPPPTPIFGSVEASADPRNAIHPADCPMIVYYFLGAVVPTFFFFIFWGGGGWRWKTQKWGVEKDDPKMGERGGVLRWMPQSRNGGGVELGSFWEGVLLCFKQGVTI